MCSKVPYNITTGQALILQHGLKDKNKTVILIVLNGFSVRLIGLQHRGKASH